MKQRVSLRFALLFLTNMVVMAAVTQGIAFTLTGFAAIAVSAVCVHGAYLCGRLDK